MTRPSNGLSATEQTYSKLKSKRRCASNAVEKLLATVQIRATVLRDGTSAEVPLEQVVPGDIVLLSAGDVIPGDCLILESKDLFVDEAALTGETYPVEKEVQVLAAETPLSKRLNTHVTSGTAKAVVVHTGTETEFGQVSVRLRVRPPETEFEHGVRRFGYLLMEVTLLLVIGIFAINVFLTSPRIGFPTLLAGAGRWTHATTATGYHQH